MKLLISSCLQNVFFKFRFWGFCGGYNPAAAPPPLGAPPFQIPRTLLLGPKINSGSQKVRIVGLMRPCRVAIANELRGGGGVRVWEVGLQLLTVDCRQQYVRQAPAPETRRIIAQQKRIYRNFTLKTHIDKDDCRKLLRGPKSIDIFSTHNGSR
jgi:hypothetical protein